MDIHNLTAEQVTAHLTEMKKSFDEAERERQFGAQPKAAPDPATPPAGDAPPKTLDDVLAANRDAAEKRDAANVLDHLIQAGLSPEATEVGKEVQDYVEGRRSISPALRAQLDAKILSWGRDAEFLKKLFVTKDAETTRLFHLAVAMRRAPIQEARS